MNKMNKRQSIACLAIALIFLGLTAVLPSCKKSTDVETEITNRILGTWTCSNHWYGGSDTYVFKSSGKYQWTGPSSEEYGDYSFNGVILTTSSSTGVTRVFTIISLTDTFFVMMDQEASSYTYYKGGSSPGNGGGDTPGGGGNNNGGGNNGGGNSGNDTPNPLDFDFSYSFRIDDYAFDEGYGTYERSLFLLFGTPAGLKSRGITEFAIGIQCLDGSISYHSGWNSSDNVYVTKEGNTIWYTGLINDDAQHTWMPFVHFVHQSSPTTSFKWAYRVKYNGSYYPEVLNWRTETFPGEIGSEFKH